ncbi:hypothetical protein [Iodidimonas sp. SYSU 1G8]|uniref:hypothetical protein n=1 Tax=Iodidimonas sp. SYSU 1G8 TaxID=3133967 RepID=UPI0031FEC9EF
MWTEQEMDDFYDGFEALLLAHNILVRQLIREGVLDRDQWSGEVRAAADDERLSPEVRATLGRIIASVKGARLALPAND